MIIYLANAAESFREFLIIATIALASISLMTAISVKYKIATRLIIIAAVCLMLRSVVPSRNVVYAIWVEKQGITNMDDYVQTLKEIINNNEKGEF